MTPRKHTIYSYSLLQAIKSYFDTKIKLMKTSISCQWNTIWYGRFDEWANFYKKNEAMDQMISFR